MTHHHMICLPSFNPNNCSTLEISTFFLHDVGGGYKSEKSSILDYISVNVRARRLKNCYQRKIIMMHFQVD